MSDNEDGPAFPVAVPEGVFYRPGMSYRAWAAGLALQGLLAHSCDASPGQFSEDEHAVATRAVKAADALIAELKK